MTDTLEENLAFESIKALYRICFKKTLQNNLDLARKVYKKSREEKQDQYPRSEFEIPEIEAFERSGYDGSLSIDEKERVFQCLDVEMMKLSEFSVITPITEIRNDHENLWKLIQRYKRVYTGKISPDHFGFIKYVERSLENYQDNT